MTEPHFDSDHATIWHGDCIDVMRGLPDASVDAVVTDPPYGLEFMGKEWDKFGGEVAAVLDTPLVGRQSSTPFAGGGQRVRYGAPGKSFQAWCEEWATEALRVLKPGGHLLAFGGTRTFHRLTAGIEDAGFEIRDSIAWLYGSGFPKSLDVSKAIDKAQRRDYVIAAQSLGIALPPRSVDDWTKEGHAPGDRWWAEFRAHLPESDWQRIERAVIGTGTSGPATVAYTRDTGGTYDVTAPATPDAARWQGWGTALKPAFEPVVVARKPLSGTVAQNVLAYGTGALNIDANRIGTPEDKKHPGTKTYTRFDTGSPSKGTQVVPPYTVGRWPANVILDEHTAPLLDAQSGITRDGVAVTRNIAGKPFPGDVYGLAGSMKYSGEDAGYGGSGGASRFFKVVADDVTEREGSTLGLCGTANTAASSSSPRSAPDGSAQGDAATSDSPAANSKKPSPAPSTNATGTALRQNESSDTPTTMPTASESSLVPQLAAPTPTSSPVNGAAAPEPTGITTTTASRSTSSGSAAPAISPTTSNAKALGDLASPLDSLTSPFWYTAKASTDERPSVDGIVHPTVKPVDLMRWLVRLVTPKGGTVLEPFAGSGTTVEAAVLEGFRCIAIEREADYLPLIMQRISKPHAVGLDFGDWEDAS